ncbi:TPA: helix-turn-helix transcriptional regulator [Salmonella enterica subsp. enterica serovar Birkenhead]
MKKLRRSFLYSNPDVEFIGRCALPYINPPVPHIFGLGCCIDIFYILKGPVELMFNTPPSKILSSGQFVFINRKCSDYFIFSGDVDSVVIHAKIIPHTLYEGMVLYLGRYNCFCVLTDENSDVLPSVSEMFQLLGNMKKIKSRAVMYLESPIALFFVHIYLNEITGSLLPLNNPDHQLFRLILEIIKKPGYSWSVKNMAKEYCMNTNVFISKFRDISGFTPFSFLKKNRLNKGRELLENTDIPVANIASQCGYNSQASFAFYIKQEFGFSPLKLRMNAKINKGNTVV